MFIISALSIKDLKYICVLSDISTELERIGDYAVNICKEKMPSSEQGICIVILLDLLVLYLA